MSSETDFVGNPRDSATSDSCASPIPFFSQAKTCARLWPEISARMEDIFDSGQFSNGRRVAELESRLAQYTGARYVIGVNSGTDALVLLLRAAGIRPGDEVIVPAYSFVATATSVVLAGGRPVFADIDPVTYALLPDELARVCGPRTRFVMPTHLFCQQADMAALCAEADRLGLIVVEDSAEGIGMRQHGVHAGLHGVGGVLSFFPTKTLGALGDAGAVLTDDPHLAGQVTGLRRHGRFTQASDGAASNPAQSVVPGTNSKMDELQAAVLLAKLDQLEADIARRAALAATYSAALADVPGVLRLPTILDRGPDSRGVFYVYLIEARDRDALVDHLNRAEIGTETYYPIPLHLQPCFAECGHRAGDFPHAERASTRAVALPLYPDLSDAEADRVCAVVRDFYAGRCCC